MKKNERAIKKGTIQRNWQYMARKTKKNERAMKKGTIQRNWQIWHVRQKKRNKNTIHDVTTLHIHDVTRLHIHVCINVNKSTFLEFLKELIDIHKYS